MSITRKNKNELYDKVNDNVKATDEKVRSIKCLLLKEMALTPRRQMFEEFEQKSEALKKRELNEQEEDDLSAISGLSWSSEEQSDDYRRLKEICAFRLENSRDCMSAMSFRRLQKTASQDPQTPQKLTDIFQSTSVLKNGSLCSNCCKSNNIMKSRHSSSNCSSNSSGSLDYVSNSTNSTSDVSYYVTSCPSRTSSNTYSSLYSSSSQARMKSYLVPSNSLALRYQKRKN